MPPVLGFPLPVVTGLQREYRCCKTLLAPLFSRQSPYEGVPFFDLRQISWAVVYSSAKYSFLDLRVMFRQKLRDFFIILESLRHDNKKSNRSLASLARVMYLAAVFLRMFLLLTSITKYCQSEIAIVLGSLPLYCWSYRLSNLAPVLQNKSLLFRLVYILGLVKQCVVNLPIGQFPPKDYLLLLERQLAIFL